MSYVSPFEYAGAGPSNDEAGHRLSLKLTRIVLSLPSVHSICDLGCGNGYLAGLLLGKGYSVVGVDASETGITVARNAYGQSAEFVCARLDAELPARLGRRFDAVVSSDVIEHLYRPLDLIECARSVLRPDGWLVIGTPYHGYVKNLALALLNRWDEHHSVDWDGGHIKFFSVKTLSQMVSAGGFTVQRFEFFGRAPWIWKNMICVAQRRE